MNPIRPSNKDWKLAARPSTKAAVQHFAKHTRRSIVETIQMAVESLYREHGMKLPEELSDPPLVKRGRPPKIAAA